MFAFKKKYFLLIENTKDINLKNIKIYNKFIIIYRNNGIMENISVLKEFRKKCRLRLIEFYIANDIKLCVMLKSDGIYLSSFNKNLKASHLKNNKFKIEFQKEIDPKNFENKLDLTKKLNEVLENMIVRNPNQWIWTHNRWK